MVWPTVPTISLDEFLQTLYCTSICLILPGLTNFTRLHLCCHYASLHPWSYWTQPNVTQNQWKQQKKNMIWMVWPTVHVQFHRWIVYTKIILPIYILNPSSPDQFYSMPLCFILAMDLLDWEPNVTLIQAILFSIHCPKLHPAYGITMALPLENEFTWQYDTAYPKFSKERLNQISSLLTPH